MQSCFYLMKTRNITEMLSKFRFSLQSSDTAIITSKRRLIQTIRTDSVHKIWSPMCYMHSCTLTPKILDQQAGVGQRWPQKSQQMWEEIQPNKSCPHPRFQRETSSGFPYLVGRLTTIKTQRNSFTGREGFAIAAEAKFGGAIIAILLSPSVPLDASVYSLGSPSLRCITHVSGSGSANLDPTQTRGGAG